MKRLSTGLVAGFLLMMVVPTATARPQPVPKRPGTCRYLYSVRRATHAARRAYRGTHRPTRWARVQLTKLAHCQRNPHNRGFVLRYYHRQRRGNAHRRHLAAHPHLDYATASWYQDGGATASGYHSYYGVANLSLTFGTKVLFVYGGRRVTAIVDDRGPYVGGRTWDLNQNVASALGFSGVATVGYHVY